MKSPRSLTLARTLQVVTFAAVLAMMSFTVRELSQSRENTLAQTSRHVAELDMVLAEQTGRSFDTVDFILRGLVDQYLVAPDKPEMLLRAAERRLEGMRQAHAIEMVDPMGQIIISTRPTSESRLPAAALSLLARLAAEPQQGAVLSEPIHEAGGRWALLMARRMDGRDGRFAGIVIAWVTLDYFESFYRAIDVADSGSILLHRRDGTVLARFPHDDAVIGVSYADLPPFRDILSKADSGTVEMESPLDGSRRILAIRALHSFPLAVNISVDEAEVLASWRRQAWTFGAIMLLGGLVTAVLMRKLARQTDEVERLLASSLTAQAQTEAVNRDLTVQMDERQRAESALRFSQRLEAVGQLTGGVAHDFNNLLTVLLGNIDLMQAHPAATIFTGRLTTMRSAAERGARLVSQLLAFARRQPLKARAVDLCELIRSMRPLLESAVGSQITMETALEPGAPPALVDQTQIELVILNLAINARDAMPLGGALRVEVCSVTLGRPAAPDAPAQGHYLALRVTDTGTGMPPDVVRRAFEPYFTTKAPGAGSGLGLSQVYGVAHQSGGTARIDSKLGEGTMVEVLLPQATGEDADNEGLHDVTPASMAAQGEANLLVVDDDTDVRVTTGLLLRRMGYRVTEANGADEALMALELDPTIELLLTDVVMPGVTGPELARKAVVIRPDLPIVYFSGYADPEAIVGAIPLARLLRKPFRPTQLVSLIETALAESRVAAIPTTVKR